VNSTNRLVWFPDTSALITLAVHHPLQHAIATILSQHDRVLVRAVADELDSLAATAGSVAVWAKTALNQLDWLGEPVRLDDPAGTALALEIQEELAAGRPLRHKAEHYGEAAILALRAGPEPCIRCSSATTTTRESPRTHDRSSPSACTSSCT